MDRSFTIRALGLYLPILIAFVLVMLKPRSPRIFAAALVGFLWTLPGLLAIQLLNLRFEWWRFHAVGGLWRGMPFDLYLGWALLWGAAPILAFRRMRVCWAIAFFMAIDLVLMPACRPVVELSGGWLVGEAIAVCVVLLPAQLLARWTLDDEHLGWRATLQMAMSASILLFWIPEIIFAMRPAMGWARLENEPPWLKSLELQWVFLLAVPGISAVQEFVLRGRGTPIPYDPPKKLVVSGMYRYVANPMQLSCFVVMMAWGGLLRNPWVAAAGVMSFLYGLGLANWDEGEDLKARFGEPWQKYRRHVRAWRMRWKPRHDSASRPALLYVAETCGPCSEVRRWFERRSTIGLAFIAAEDHPAHDLRRITYDPQDGNEPEDGIRAIARGLEHIHFGWAFAGACLRLPMMADVVQVLMDASGFGPRLVLRRTGGGVAAAEDGCADGETRSCGIR